MSDSYPDLSVEYQNIPIYQYVRKRIDDFKITEILQKPKDEKEREYKTVLKIIYLFGGESAEIIGSSTNTDPIIGNDFYQTSIGNHEAIVLSIPTNRKGARYRDIAIPLNPKYEEWSKDVLEFTEEKGKKSIWGYSYGNLIDWVGKTFSVELPIAIYQAKTDKSKESRNITINILKNIRLLELGLCYNFNEYEFKHFCGDIIAPDYNEYFNKLLEKSDFYNKTDIYDSLEIKDRIFSPKGSDRYNYKDYMNIVKKINRGYISKSNVNKIIIDRTVDIDKLKRTQSGGKEHKILMLNAENEIYKAYGESVINVDNETANLDVVAQIKQDSEIISIIFECGDSYAHKMLEAFGNVYSDVVNASQFWVLNYSDEITGEAEYYKFTKNENYR